MSKQADVRVRLDEIKARTDLPDMAAALTAVLDLCRDMHAAYERDPHGDAIAYEFERAIEKHLPKADGV